MTENTKNRKDDESQKIPVGKSPYKTVVYLTVTVMLSLLVLIPNFNNGWTNWDDDDYVLDNSLVKEHSAGQLARIFSTLEVQGNYHPLTVLSLAIDHAIAGEEPWIYHTTNSILHLLNVVLVFWFIYLLVGRPEAAAIAALLFGIHPMHLESVAWISERKDVLYSFFFLGGLVTYSYYLKEKRAWLLVLCFFLFLLSLLSKGMAVTFPLILLLIDYLRNRPDRTRLLIEKVPFLVASLGFGILAIIAQRAGDALTDIERFPFYQNIAVSLYGVWMYLLKLVAPFQLSAFHPYPGAVSGTLDWYVYAAAIPVIALAFFAYRAAIRSRAIAFGLGFFLVSIAPVLQVLSVGNAIISERFTYIAYIGLFYLLGLSYTRVIEGNTVIKAPYIQLLKATVVIYILLMGWFTFQRSAVWENSESLWTDVIDKYPKDYFAYGSRANFWVREGNFDKALADYRACLERNPYFFEAYNNRGLIYMQQGNYEAALSDFSKAIELAPQFPKAWLNRGIIFMNQSKNPEALNDMNKAIEMQAGDPLTYYNRGLLQLRMGDYRKAIEDFSQALQLQPDQVLFYKGRGIAYYLSKNFPAAIKDFSKALLIDPNDGELYLRRSVAWRDHGNKQAALNDALEAQKRNYRVRQAYLESLKVELQ